MLCYKLLHVQFLHLSRKWIECSSILRKEEISWNEVKFVMCNSIRLACFKKHFFFFNNWQKEHHVKIQSFSKNILISYGKHIYFFYKQEMCISSFFLGWNSITVTIVLFVFLYLLTYIGLWLENLLYCRIRLIK